MSSRSQPWPRPALILSCALVACADVRPLADDPVDLCRDCHGDRSADNAAPPPAFWHPGVVDAHQTHLVASESHAAVPCESCHRVPEDTLDVGHLDTPLPAEVLFSGLAAESVDAVWDGDRCTVYCHGTTLVDGGGANTRPRWYDPSANEAACDACHGQPPSGTHPARSDCETCHPSVIEQSGDDPVFASGELHVNGSVEVIELECDTCHGSDGVAAPPSDTEGNRSTDARGVGAHRSHLIEGSEWHALVSCDQCHLVPLGSDDPGHRDTPLPAELIWGSLATADGAAPDFDGTGCTNVYCHGGTLSAGTNVAPAWTVVDGSEAVCGSCHGLPPANGHVQRTDCAACHGAVIGADGTFVDPARHIDGSLDVDLASLDCNDCHGQATGDAGDATTWAPPRDLSGNTGAGARGVGAHQAHLASSTWRATITCDTCHVVPVAANDPGHRDTPLPAELVFANQAVARGAEPAFDGTRCTNAYCHGATLLHQSGALMEPEWTSTGAGTCGACHEVPPSDPPHPPVQGFNCSGCHPFTGPFPDDPERHIDGVLDVNVECGSCHEVPPDTGAHRAHTADTGDPTLVDVPNDLRVAGDFFPSGNDDYVYGCGHCHPLDTALHFDGVTQVELFDGGAPVGSIKAHNPASASYDAITGTCSDVYCHSSGQQAPVFVITPPWDGALPADRCASCHANPPRYPSGGEGSATANTHVVLADDGYELGHFGGLPGPWHTSLHGGAGAAPMTCQTCHYDSVHPANTGSGGFYYLDTTGDYDLGGALGYACVTCHTGDIADPPEGVGRAWPRAHVNGVRDVTFDPRDTSPGNPAGLPSAPRYPYWLAVTGSSTLPGGATQDGLTWSATLAGSSYDSATKSCFNVPCHLNQSYGGASIADPLIWGKMPVGWATCNDCHQF